MFNSRQNLIDWLQRVEINLDYIIVNKRSKYKSNGKLLNDSKLKLNDENSIELYENKFKISNDNIIFIRNYYYRKFLTIFYEFYHFYI